MPGHQLGLVAGVTKVETPDPYTVVFTLGSANTAFDQTMANPFMAILPCEGTKGEFDLATDAIGTGPFVLKSWKRDQERVMEKNPDYFVEGLPHRPDHQEADHPQHRAHGQADHQPGQRATTGVGEQGVERGPPLLVVRVAAGEAFGLAMAHEVFADRAYEDDGNLVSRRKPGAVLHDANEIAARVVKMVQTGEVVSITGKTIKMRMDTVCIHGDTPGAVDIARILRKALADNRIEVAPFKTIK